MTFQKRTNETEGETNSSLLGMLNLLNRFFKTIFAIAVNGIQNILFLFREVVVIPATTCHERQPGFKRIKIDKTEQVIEKRLEMEKAGIIM